ncbi:MAG: hypothetical protein M1819_006849 [Sarea resinae]|nr:MAG: hypothetical protein M1819_006849 [Sarea resinae]
MRPVDGDAITRGECCPPLQEDNVSDGSALQYSSGPSRKALLRMVLPFLLGVCAAIGHHVYYESLAGTLAGSAHRQQWSSFIGTAFAFLAKASFVSAVAVAYIQPSLTVTPAPRPRQYQKEISAPIVDYENIENYATTAVLCDSSQQVYDSLAMTYF